MLHLMVPDQLVGGLQGCMHLGSPKGALAAHGAGSHCACGPGVREPGQALQHLHMEGCPEFRQHISEWAFAWTFKKSLSFLVTAESGARKLPWGRPHRTPRRACWHRSVPHSPAALHNLAIGSTTPRTNSIALQFQAADGLGNIAGAQNAQSWRYAARCHALVGMVRRSNATSVCWRSVRPRRDWVGMHLMASR